jgi:hypothetical protein
MAEHEPLPPDRSPVERFTDWLKTATGLVTTLTGFGVALVAFVAFLSGTFTQSSPTPRPTYFPQPTFAPVESVDAGLTVDEWAVAADGACARNTHMFSEANQLARTDMAAALDGTSDAAFTLALELRAIEQPASRSADVERFISRWEEGGRAMADAAEAVRGGNMDSLDAAAARYDQATDGAGEIARGLGALKCAALVTN